MVGESADCLDVLASLLSGLALLAHLLIAMIGTAITGGPTLNGPR